MMNEKIDLERASDENLMLRCQNGDIRAFEVLFNRYKDRIITFVYRLIGNYEESQDISSETFIRIFKRANSYRYPSKFTTWAYRIARNLSLDLLKKQSRHPTISLQKTLKYKDGKEYQLEERIANGKKGPDEKLIEKELQFRLKKAISQIPYIYREAIAMYIFEGLSYKEISRIVRCPQVTIRWRIHQGINILRKLI